MKAIQTRYLGPTTYRGARIKAFDLDGNSVTIPYPYELSGQECHRKAAEALMEKMAWSGRIVGGALKRGYSFVFVEG